MLRGAGAARAALQADGTVCFAAPFGLAQVEGRNPAARDPAALIVGRVTPDGKLVSKRTVDATGAATRASIALHHDGRIAFVRDRARESGRITDFAFGQTVPTYDHTYAALVYAPDGKRLMEFTATPDRDPIACTFGESGGLYLLCGTRERVELVRLEPDGQAVSRKSYPLKRPSPYAISQLHVSAAEVVTAIGNGKDRFGSFVLRF